MRAEARRWNISEKDGRRHSRYWETSCDILLSINNGAMRAIQASNIRKEFLNWMGRGGRRLGLQNVDNRARNMFHCVTLDMAWLHDQGIFTGDMDGFDRERVGWMESEDESVVDLDEAVPTDANGDELVNYASADVDDDADGSLWESNLRQAFGTGPKATPAGKTDCGDEPAPEPEAEDPDSLVLAVKQEDAFSEGDALSRISALSKQTEAATAEAMRNAAVAKRAEAERDRVRALLEAAEEDLERAQAIAQKSGEEASVATDRLDDEKRRAIETAEAAAVEAKRRVERRLRHLKRNIDKI